MVGKSRFAEGYRIFTREEERSIEEAIKQTYSKEFDPYNDRVEIKIRGINLIFSQREDTPERGVYYPCGGCRRSWKLWEIIGRD